MLSKREHNKDNKIPGPGHYTVSSPTKEGHDFGKSKGHSETKTDPNNGPGSYNVEVPAGSNAYTIGERREQKTQDTLGPGQYSPEKADGQVRPSSASYMIQSKRELQQRDDLPGPGQYSFG